MDGAGNELLARAGLAVDQHRRFGGRHLFELAQHVAQRRALADDLFEPTALLAKVRNNVMEFLRKKMRRIATFLFCLASQFFG